MSFARFAPLLFLCTFTAQAGEFDSDSLPVGISANIKQVSIKHAGKEVIIKRNPDNAHTVDDNYAKTSRPCPPFCIQPMTLAPGVETIGELELIDYLQRLSSGDNTLLVIDSRTPVWVDLGSIPGAINIPWKKLSLNHGTDPLSLIEILEAQFNVQQHSDFLDFKNAKTLVMFCNGMWCGQSPSNIKTLLRLGYPAHKLKWYRGGMQNWNNLGLTTVKP
ncbi:MAG: rhodanese-like domain-containing protein [Gammaproteobacteria bacterium]|nr:rhodanese-like domain-containing protein [Gammaproteobacteria bacterium]